MTAVVLPFRTRTPEGAFDEYALEVYASSALGQYVDMLIERYGDSERVVLVSASTECSDPEGVDLMIFKESFQRLGVRPGATYEIRRAHIKPHAAVWKMLLRDAVILPDPINDPE